MDKTFNSKEFIDNLAKELIENFTKAGSATTPVLVGTARENEAKKKLQKILPSSVAVTSGCVIDTYGHTSKQIDVIIYEKDICPIFSINDTPDATYVPCESVIAVGEIKSALSKVDLEDAFAKIRSVKQTKRYFERTDGTRSYGSKIVMHEMETTEYDQGKKDLDQIYGFILAQNIALKTETFLEHYKTLCLSDDYLLPNMTVSLADGVFVFVNEVANKVEISKLNATSIFNTKNPHGDFQFLLTQIKFIIDNGRTTHILPFNKYIINDTDLPGQGLYIRF